MSSELWYRRLSILALVAALGASGVAVYRIWKGDVSLEDATMTTLIPFLGSAVLASPSLRKVAVEKRLEKLELEGK